MCDVREGESLTWGRRSETLSLTPELRHSSLSPTVPSHSQRRGRGLWWFLLLSFHNKLYSSRFCEYIWRLACVNPSVIRQVKADYHLYCERPHPVSGRGDITKTELPQEDGTPPADGLQSHTALALSLPQASNRQPTRRAWVCQCLRARETIPYNYFLEIVCIFMYLYVCIYVYVYLLLS